MKSRMMNMVHQNCIWGQELKSSKYPTSLSQHGACKARNVSRQLLGPLRICHLKMAGSLKVEKGNILALHHLGTSQNLMLKNNAMKSMYQDSVKILVSLDRQ